MNPRIIDDIRERVIVALDMYREEDVLRLISQLEKEVKYVKVGMELFYSTGFPMIEKLKEKGLKIFLDLKMHDIPTTVGKATGQLTRLGVDMFNLHVAGGIKMMEEARNNIDKNLINQQKKPLLIGVTQLTSTDQRMLETEIGIVKPIENVVVDYALLAKKAGLDGVVSSPNEVQQIKNSCGTSFLTVTPGIRLKNADNHDQKRITTPEQAFEQGSDFIVVGRSITAAENPLKSFQEIIQAIKKMETDNKADS